MKKLLFVFLTLGGCYFSTFAQKEFFQQKVDYFIQVQLDETQHILTGNETIYYHNNSPDTLNYIYFHLWANAYQKKSELAKQMANRMNGKLYFEANKYGGYIDSLDFTSQSAKLKWNYLPKNKDICIVYLPKPLLPNESVEISTPFRVKLPQCISRMCHDSAFYSITQWYPKPAVYDRYGWHPMPYLDLGEFYSEFGKYNVFITVPRNFVVAATGNLQNQDELAWLKEIAKSNKLSSQINNPNKYLYKTLHFSDSLIHDFAWFAYESCYVDFDSVDLPTKRVYIWAFYPQENKNSMQNATKYINNAIRYFSQWLGDYPYNNCSVVYGPLKAGGGMEYPQITIITGAGSPEIVIIHEVGHNWNQGILAYNERRYPFLDEGLTTFYQYRYSEIFPHTNFVNNFNLDYKIGNHISYSMLVLTGRDQPLNLHSTDYSAINYGLIPYLKTASSLKYMERQLGPKTFDTIMQSFFSKWKFKHPYPCDFEAHFKNSTTQNIDWFFEGYVKSDKYADFKLRYRNNKLFIINKGKIKAPVVVAAYTNDTIADTVILPPFNDKKYKYTPAKNYQKFIIDPNFETLDLNRYNNFVKTKGFFRNYNSIKISPIAKFMNFYDFNLQLLPFVWYNKSSKFQIISLISNLSLPLKKFKFILMPSYSFGNKNLEGYLFAENQIIGHDGFPDIFYTFVLDKYPALEYPNYINLRPFRRFKNTLKFNFRNTSNSSKYNKTLSLSLFLINTKAVYLNTYKDTRYKFTAIYNVLFEIEKKSIFRFFNFKTNLDIYSNNTIVFWSEINKHLHYFSVWDGLDIRLYAGVNTPLFGSTGSTNTKFDEFYFSRYADLNYPYSFFSHQFSDNYGGFVHFSDFSPKKILFSLNLKTTFPQVPIFKVFTNIATDADFIAESGFKQINFNSLHYEYGIMLDFFNNFFAVYLPLSGSKQVIQYSKTHGILWYQKIRFTLKLEKYKTILTKF